MIDLFAQQQQQQQHHPHFGTSRSLAARPHSAPRLAAWQVSHCNMDPRFDSGAQPQQSQYPHQYHTFSSPAGPSSSRSHDDDVSAGTLLPHQSFSSPNTAETIYPASTLAAVEAARARFFAHQSGRSAPPPRTHARVHKSNPLSTSYRQSFFDRCQRAMHQSRSSARSQRVTAFRKGVDGATPGLFSDEMVMDQDDGSTASSPPPQGEAQHEDDELTRHRILAEYARLKRIYELKGELEIGWIDPDQLSWLESQVSREQAEDKVDPYWTANDEEFEQLWRESLASSQRRDEDEFDDAELDEVLARLPV